MNRRTFMSATGAMLGTGAFASVASFPLISASPSATEPALSNWDDVRKLSDAEELAEYKKIVVAQQMNSGPLKPCYQHLSKIQPPSVQVQPVVFAIVPNRVGGSN